MRPCLAPPAGRHKREPLLEGALPIRFCDEFEHGFGWISDEFLARTSHALVTDDGGVWLVDPLEWDKAERRVTEVGEPRAVIQLLDRHPRDCAAIAARFGIPHHVVPFFGVGSFGTIPVVDRRWWREAALWWPREQVLVTADVLGTTGYFTAGKEPLGVHPLRRLTPPRALAQLDPLHILCGHGEGVHGDVATPALHEALRTARRRLPRAWLGSFRRGSSRGTH